MLGQRRRRWASIKTTLFQCIVFDGWASMHKVPDNMAVMPAMIAGGVKDRCPCKIRDFG